VLNTTREVVGFRAFPIAAAHSSPCLRAGSAWQFPASLYLLLNILFKEAQDAFNIFVMLAKARWKKQAELVGSHRATGEKLALKGFIICRPLEGHTDLALLSNRQLLL